MDFLTKFHDYLFSQKKIPSVVTVKNYLSDVRRFIRWYENRFSNVFTPSEVTPQILLEFKKSLEVPSVSGRSEEAAAARSIDRYFSSLRKFFTFLVAEEVISTNPFDLLSEAIVIQKDIDIWHLKDFKDFLYKNNASQVTIKNYIIDLKQFTSWISLAAHQALNYEVKEVNLFSYITPYVLEEYKQRLLTDAKVSPNTLNRKLSSLRKYITWAQKQGHITHLSENQLPKNVPEDVSPAKAEPIEIPSPTDMPTEAMLATLPALPEEITDEVVPLSSTKSFSSIPPVRLLQRTSRLGTALFDIAVVTPILASHERFGYLLWKLQGSPIFTTPEARISNKIHKALKNTFIMKKVPVKKASLVSGLPKSFYAPLSMSMKNAPLKQQLWFHIRFTRPNWYKTYHSYAIVHYLHGAILVICMTIAGFGVVSAVNEDGTDNLAYASLPDGPPRMVAFKGKLTRSDASPITAPTKLRFGLYNDSTASGSALLWEELQEVHPEKDGTFTTMLGSRVRMSQRLFSENARLYIGMTVENNAELNPRKQIPTDVLAATANTVQGLRPITDPGAGEKNTLLALDSSGNLVIGGDANPTFSATGGTLTLSGQTLLLTTALGSNTDVILSPDGAGQIDIQKPIHNTSESNNQSGVAGAVEIADNVVISATGSAQSALYINQNSTGPLISASVSGIAKFTLENTGAASFGDNLMIHGSALNTTQTTFNLLSTNPINLNIGNSATALTLGATGGATTIRNAETIISGNLSVNGGKGITFGNADSGITFSGSGNHLISATAGSLQLGAVTLTGATTLTKDVSIIPSGVDGENNLGSSVLPFDTIYVNNIVSPSLSNTAQWKTESGALSPTSLTSSILVGSSASSSAVWQVFASGANAGTASSSGNLAFSNVSTTIDQLNGGSLTFRTSPGGNDGLSAQMTLTNSGNVGLGTTAPAYRLDLPNNADATGQARANAWVTYSSRRYKENITVIADPLEKISRLQGVYYKWKQEYGGSQDMGFIAEEVGQVLPELVEYEADGINAKSLKYDRLTALLIEGMKAQQKEIESLKHTAQGVFLTQDPTYHILASDGGVFEVANSHGEKSASTGIFRKALIATLETGQILARAIKTETLEASESILGTVRAQTIASDFIDVTEMTIHGTIKADRGTILNLHTDLISSTDPESELSLGFGKTELNLYNKSEKVIAFDTMGNARFSGGIIASSGSFNELITQEASVSGTLQAQKIKADELEMTDEGIVKLLGRLSQVTGPKLQSSQLPASQPATLPPASASAQLTDTLTTEYELLASSAATASLIEPLAAMNHTDAVYTDLSVASALIVSGNLILSEESIDVIGADLQIQPLRSGAVSFMAGLVTIDQSGNMSVSGNAAFAQDVTIKGKLAANVLSPIDQGDLKVQLNETNQGFVVQDASGEAKFRVANSGDVSTEGDGTFASLLSKSLTIMKGKQVDASPIKTIADASAGSAVILAGQTQRTIVTPFVKEGSLIYISPTSDTQGAVPYISRQTVEGNGSEGSFTIQISQSVTKPIKINWWIVN